MADHDERVSAAGLTARALGPADLEMIMELVTAYDLDFFGEPMLDTEDVLAAWSAPSFDLARDTLGYLDRDVLVAAGALTFRGELELELRRPLRNSEVEAAVSDHFERLAGSRGMSSVHRVVAEADTDRKAFLTERGYRLDFIGWVSGSIPRSRSLDRSCPPATTSDRSGSPMPGTPIR